MKQIQQNKKSSKKKMAVQSNALINARYDMTAFQKKILLYIIAKIQPEDKDFQNYTINVKDFVDEAVNKTGRLLAIESGAATTAGVAREYAENEDLSPGAALAVEVLAGVAGGFAGAGAYKIPKSLLKKVQGKNATEIMEMVSNGSIEYKDLDWALESKPLFKDDGAFNMDAPVTPQDKTQPLGVIVDGKKIPQTPKPTMPGVVRESFEFQAARQEIANNVSNKQKVEAAVALNNLNNYGPEAPFNPKRMINKILSVFAPSKVLGNDIVNEIEMAKGTINRAQELGARVKRVVGRLEKKDNPAPTSQ